MLRCLSFPPTGQRAGSGILIPQALGALGWLSASRVSLNPSGSEFSDAGSEHSYCSQRAGERLPAKSSQCTDGGWEEDLGMGTCRTWWRDELLPSHRHLEKCLQREKGHGVVCPGLLQCHTGRPSSPGCKHSSASRRRRSSATSSSATRSRLTVLKLLGTLRVTGARTRGAGGWPLSRDALRAAKTAAAGSACGPTTAQSLQGQLLRWGSHSGMAPLGKLELRSNPSGFALHTAEIFFVGFIFT